MGAVEEKKSFMGMPVSFSLPSVRSPQSAPSTSSTSHQQSIPTPSWVIYRSQWVSYCDFLDGWMLQLDGAKLHEMMLWSIKNFTFVPLVQ